MVFFTSFTKFIPARMFNWFFHSLTVGPSVIII